MMKTVTRLPIRIWPGICRLARWALIAALSLALGGPWSGRAAPTGALTVCPSGCDHTSLQAAINAAAAGDTIQLLTTVPHTEADIVINKDVVIQGIDTANSIVQATAVQGTATSRVFTVLSGVQATFRDLTIRYGDGGLQDGGAILNSGGDVRLEGVDVEHNEARSGGGIYNTGTLTLVGGLVIGNAASLDGGGVYSTGALTVQGGQFAANLSDGSGGGIYNAGTATVADHVLFENRAGSSPSSIARGGGIYNEGALTVLRSWVLNNEVLGSSPPGELSGGAGIFSAGSLTVADSKIRDNLSFTDSQGGGVIVYGGDAWISRTEFRGNNAVSGAGGGLFVGWGNIDTVQVVDSSLVNNQASGDGGGVWAETDVPFVLHNSTLAGNVAGFRGGGLYACGAGPDLVNVTIADNEADDDGGGAFVCASGLLRLANVTITGNTADADDANGGDGGGVHVSVSGDLSGTVTLANSLVAWNSDLTSAQFGTRAPDCYGTLTSAGYNLIGDLGTALLGVPCEVAGDPTGVQIGTYPGLDSLADNGGPTQTAALFSDSSAVNAGDPAGCADPDGLPLPADQRHALRPDRCDLGAFEFGGLVERVLLAIVVK